MRRDRFYLSDRIRMYIENSHLEGGGRLPSNEELAERFKVQKGTVRAALERLKEEGIVYLSLIHIWVWASPAAAALKNMPPGSLALCTAMRP